MNISIQNIKKSYNGKVALNSISFLIPEGIFFSILGKSGSGKSTLLRLIAGLEKPESGRIEFDGKDAAATLPHKRRTAMVFQNYALFPHLSVFENVAFAPREQKQTEDEIRRNVTEKLTLLGIEKKAKSKISELSGGEQQRVAIARALATGFETILFDEPLSNLDAPLRKELQKELKAIQRESGQTFIYVTHDQEEALSLSNGIAILENGLLKEYGAPDEIYNSPKSLIGALFLGESVGLSAARIATNEVKTERGMILKGESEIPHEKVAVVIRPESIEPFHSSFGDETLNEKKMPPNVFKAEVKASFFKGSFTEYVIRAGDEMLLMHAPSGFTGGLVRIKSFFIFPLS
ncbi:MAG: ABC transporter ATP-binding protein [Chloroherpetonaceae bacterium]|nr:ABC transporter ATP-binding protein [Chloroherpetonaceae bacterium]